MSDDYLEQILRRDFPGIAEHLDARVAELRAEMEAHSRGDRPVDERGAIHCEGKPFAIDPTERPSAQFQRRVLQRIEADPCAVLAGDLLEMLVSQGDTAHEDLAAMSRSCREAAETCHRRVRSGIPPPEHFAALREEFAGLTCPIPPPGAGFVDPGVEGEPFGRMRACPDHLDAVYDLAQDGDPRPRPAHPRSGEPSSNGLADAELAGERGYEGDV